MNIKKTSWSLFFFIILAFILFIKTPLTYFQYDFSIVFIIIICPIIVLLKLSRIGTEKKINYNQIPIYIFYLLNLTLLLKWYFSPYSYFSSRIYIFHSSSIFVFLIASYIFNNINRSNLFIYSFLTLISIGSIYTIGEYLGYIPNNQIHKFPVEITGHIGHKNVFGVCAMIGYFYNLHLLLNKTKYRNLLILSNIIIGISLLLSDSRGSLVLTILGSIIILIPTLIKLKKNEIKLRYAFYFSLFLICFLPILFWNDNTWIRIAKLFIKSTTLSHRSEIYRAQWLMILNKPLWGNGFASLIHDNYYFWSSWMKKKMIESTITFNGHCEYLETLTELGIIGSFFYFFFWFGALKIGFTNLIKKWSAQDYLFLVSMIMMMIHALFSVSSKRVPSSLLLWLHIGYFWRFNFTYFCYSISNKYRQYIFIGFGLLTILVWGVAFQIMISDYFYKSSIIGQSIHPKSISRLNRSLKIFPNHPFSLHQLARFSMGFENYDYTINACNILQKTAPNIFFTNYLKGDAFYHKNDLDSALYYVKKELQMHPNSLKSKELKGRILAKNGSCENLKKMQNYYRILISPPIQDISPEITDSIDNEIFKSHIGPLRYKFGGPNLYKAWKKHKIFHTPQSINNRFLMENIINLKCSDK